MICLVVFPVSTSAQENSDHVIRVGSFEETYNVVNEKGERSGYGYPMRRKTPCFSYGDIRRVHRIYASN